MENETRNFIPDENSVWYRNKTLIGIARILFFIYLFIGIAVLFISLTLQHSVADREANRSLDYTTAFIYQDVPVHININTENMPVCTTQNSPKSIFLLLDVSNSMKGVPLKNEAEGTNRIVTQFDLSQTAISVITFNNYTQSLILNSSNEDDLLGSLENLQASGGTDIGFALKTASDILHDGNQSQGEQNYVLLFTDGGSDPVEAKLQAQNVKDTGAILYVIGLRGEDFNENLLTQLVDDPNNVLIADNANQIADLFSEVGTQIQNDQISNFSVVEPVNTDVFIVNHDPSLSNPINLQDGSYSNPAQYSQEYFVQPQKIGLFEIVNPGGTITFADCEGNLHNYTLDSGPKLLVIPPLFLILPGYLLPLLLLSLFSFWPRKPEKVWREPAHVPDYEEPFFPMMLNHVSEAKTNSLENEITYSPTVIIGLGTTGFETLNLLKKNLLEFGEGNMPTGIQLLWIGNEISEPKLSKKLYLDHKNEIHRILPEFDRLDIETENPGITSRFSWWQKSTMDSKDRADGRMTFFYDVLFSTAKPLKKRFEKISNKFSEEGHTAYRVFIVTSPAELESAMMPDIAYWLRCQFHGKVKRVLPWLLLEPIDHDDNLNISQLRYAAMREIQRFIIAPDQLMETEDGKYDIQDGYLFDGCMIFDHPSNPDATKYDVVHSIADQIIVLLEEGVAEKFDQDMTDFMGKITKNQDNCLFVTSNNFCFYLPVEPIRRVCEVKMIQDIFFSGGNGKGEISGLFVETSDEINEPGKSLSLAEEFFLWKTEEINNSPFQIIIELVHDQWIEGVIDYFPGNLEKGYQWKLLLYLNFYMNAHHQGNENKPINYYKVKRLINELNRLWDVVEEKLTYAQTIRGKEHVAFSLKESLSGFRQVNKKMLEALNNWEQVIFAETDHGKTETQQQTQRFRTTFSSIRVKENSNLNNEKKIPFSQFISEQYNDRFNELKNALQSSDTKSIVLDSKFTNDTQNNVDEIIDYYYHQYFLITEDNEENELAMLGSHFGWHWEFDNDDDLVLYLVAVNTKTEQKVKNGNSRRFLINYRDFYSRYDEILTMLPEFSKILRNKMNLTDLLRHHEKDVTQILESEKQDRLLGYKLINDTNYCQQRPFLLHPNRAQALTWAESLVTQNFETMEIKNPTCAMGIWFVYKVPASIIELLEEDKESYFAVPELHVYPAEQYAVKQEIALGVKPGESELLHPRIVRMMNYPDLFEVALYSLLYGWLKTEEDELGNIHYILSAPNMEPFRLECSEVVNPDTLEEALQSMTVLLPWKCLDSYHPLHMNNLSKTIDLLHSQIKKTRETSFEQRKERFDLVEEGMIQKWINSNNRVQRDLARLLRLMIKQESKY